MSIFSRYIFRQAGGAFMLVLLSLSGIVWISLALRELNVVTGYGQSAFTLLKMTTLGLPGFMAVIAPFALLIAVIHTLNRLNSDSEIIVYAASGATNWSIARPLMVLAVLVSAFLVFMHHVGMPWSLRLLREMVIQVRTDLLTQVIQPGRFSSPEQGLTIHIRERTFQGVLEDLIMHDTRDPRQVRSYLAEQGIIVKQDDTAYLMMSDGHILDRSDPSEPARIVAFEKYAVDLDRFEAKNSDAVELRPRERYLGELLDPEDPAPVETGDQAEDQKQQERRRQREKQSPGMFTAELHERFASPLYPIAFTLIALAFVGQAQSTRQTRGQRIAAGFTAAAATRLAGFAANNLVVLNTAAVPLLYAIPVLGMVVPLVLISRRTRLRAGTPWVERLVDAAAPLVAVPRRIYAALRRPSPSRV